MSGNSHQRRVAKSLIQSALTATTSTQTLLPLNEGSTLARVGVLGRVAALFEYGPMQTIIGLVGSLAGTFLDGRYFALLAVFIPYTLSRSSALSGLPLRISRIFQITGLAICAAALFYLGIRLNKSRPHVFTPSEYASAVRSGTPLPITQQVTNIYNNNKYSDVQSGAPRIDFTEWQPDGFDAIGTNWYTNVTNDGNAPAVGVIGTVQSAVLPESSTSEDHLFAEIERKSYDTDAPKEDIAPGPKYARMQPLRLEMSATEQQAWKSGTKVIYLGAAKTYQDVKGNRYISELCMYSQVNSRNGRFCNGHNYAKRLPTPK